MTKLNYDVPDRGVAYDPGPFLGELPLLSTETRPHAGDRTRALFNPTPSFYAQNAPAASRHPQVP